jgi:NAD dependent epimerase/dehydratase family enzyme
MENRKIVIAGGTGFIGRELANYFAPANEVVILTRHIKAANNAATKLTGKSFKNNVRLVHWNGINTEGWLNEIDGCDCIINLAGKSVNCRYTTRNKKEIIDSRINPTKAIGEAIRRSTVPPKLWINAASATIYRNAFDKPQDEYNGEIENDFSVQVCKT